MNNFIENSRYCLDKFPKPEERVHWFCEQCEPSSTLASLGELVIGNGRSNDDLECDDMQKDSSGIPRPRDKKLGTSSHVVDVLPKFSRPQDRKRVTSGCNEVIPLGRILNDETSGPKHKRVSWFDVPEVHLQKDYSDIPRSQDKKQGTSSHVEIVRANITNTLG